MSGEGYIPTTEEKDVTTFADKKEIIGASAIDSEAGTNTGGSSGIPFKSEIPSLEEAFENISNAHISEKFQLSEDTKEQFTGVKPSGYDSDEIKNSAEKTTFGDPRSGKYWNHIKMEGVPA
jgi:hypothetical protein